MQIVRTETEARAEQRKVLVLGPGEGEAVWFLDNLIAVKLRSKDGARFGLLESRVPAGSITPFHRHHDEDEGFYVLDGEIKLYLEGGRELIARSGAYVHIPRGVAHGFRAQTELRMLVLSDPDGFVEMIREAGAPAPRRELPPGPPDFSRLETACKRRHIELLGPLPE